MAKGIHDGYKVYKTQPCAITTERSTGQQLFARQRCRSARLYHYHGGLKLQCKVLYEQIGRAMRSIGHICPICGYLPSEQARAESQLALEAVLQQGFVSRKSSKRKK